MHARLPFHVPLLSLTAVAAAWLLSAPAAHAGPLVAAATDCEEAEPSRPFLRWADVAHYVLVPDGTVEREGDWTLEDGAEQIDGNETFFVNDPDDDASLSLPAGAEATTAPMCVGLEHPTLRFLARNEGSQFSSLLVEVLFEDAGGQVRRLPIGLVQGDRSWEPSLPLPIVANLLPLLPGGYTAVAFRFKALSGGDWSIDDIYVDPWRHG